MNKQLEKLARACPAKSFKAFIGKSRTQAILCAVTGAEIVGWGGFDDSSLEQQSQRKALARYIAAADPKTVLALLVELEGAQQRIAELEQLPTIKHIRSVEESLISASDRAEAAENRIAELEREVTDWKQRAEHFEGRFNDAFIKLATPVRLPLRRSVYEWYDHADTVTSPDYEGDYFDRDEVIEALRNQGFKVEGVA